MISAFTPATRCMRETGNNLLTVTVWTQADNKLDAGATVTATVTKPDSSTEDINFSSGGDGNYTNNYNFDSNGTWKFSVTASHSGYTDETLESYVYVGDFNLLISFVSNGQNVFDRDTSSLRSLVTNDDGNYFTGIEGNVTIYYPNNSVWVSNQAMTEAGDGEYYYNFTAPTTLGEYSATSTFACGSNTDSNSQGRFTVVSSCGNGTCDTWESCSSCSADCGACDTEPSPGGPGGGGPGGGGAAPPAYDKPKIASWSFEETPSVGDSTAITLEILNPDEKKDFFVSVKISQVRETFYSYEERLLEVKRNETRNVVLEQEFLPRIAGTHTIEIKLLSFDKRTVYDEVVETFDLEGKVRYDTIVECVKDVVKLGGNASAKITMLNLGDYYEDIVLRWWVEGPDRRVIGQNSLAMALYTNESKELVRSIHIPKESPAGSYIFVAEVDYKGQKTEAKCSFLVEEDKDYYGKVLEEKEEKIRELAQEAEGKKREGFDVSTVEEKIRNARILSSTIRGKIEREDFDGLDEKLEELDAVIEEIEIGLEIGARLPQIWLGLKEGLLLLALILLIILAIILWKSKKLLDKLLGLEEPDEERPEKSSFAEKMLGFGKKGSG